MADDLNTNVYAAMNVFTQAMVTVMTVNIFASALGILLAATTMEAIPKETKATRKGLASLREAFGGDVVDKAVKEVGTEDIVQLAMKVEELVKARMYERYGEWETETALRAAPPGDLRTAGDIAAALHARRAAPDTPEKIAAAEGEGLKKAKAAAKPVTDTKTGIMYKSESAAGKAVAAEYGLDPDDHFVWYKIIKTDPDRFRRV